MPSLPLFFLCVAFALTFIGCSPPPSQNQSDGDEEVENSGFSGNRDGPLAVCGNGELEEGELCDDGNRRSSDYCSALCDEILGRCGDDITQANEECDLGDENQDTCPEYGSQEVCRACIDCQWVESSSPYCGDHVLQPEFGEECEHPEPIENIGPNFVPIAQPEKPWPRTHYCEDCKLYEHACGNGEIEPDEGEVCDDGWRARDVPYGVGACLRNCSGYAHIESITVTESNSLARIADGNLYIWGGDEDGQIGNSTRPLGTPSRYLYSNEIARDVSASGSLICRNGNGTWRCHGGPFGFLRANETPWLYPFEAMFSPTREFEFVEPMPFAAAGTFVCGVNRLGTTGCYSFAGDFLRHRAFPARIDTLLPSPTEALFAGRDRMCARLESGAVRCWDGASVSAASPESAGGFSTSEVSELRDAEAIYLGDSATLYLTDGGELLGFGENAFGQLDWPAGTTPEWVSFRHQHACIITVAGTIQCRGRNDHGQLGGSPGESFHEITEIMDPVQVEVGLEHTCALDGAGDVWCWGSNADGKLGLGNLDGLDYPPTKITDWAHVWTPQDSKVTRPSVEDGCADDSDCPGGFCFEYGAIFFCSNWNCSYQFDSCGEGRACLSQGSPDRSFCLPMCSREVACPEGYTCDGSYCFPME